MAGISKPILIHREDSVVSDIQEVAGGVITLPGSTPEYSTTSVYIAIVAGILIAVVITLLFMKKKQ